MNKHHQLCNLLVASVRHGACVSAGKETRCTEFPDLVRLEIPRAFSQGPVTHEGTQISSVLGWLHMLCAHALLTSPKNASSPQKLAE